MELPTWVIGAGGMVAGTAAAGYAISYGSRLFNFIRNRLIASFEIVSNDPAFPAVMAWLADNNNSRFSRAVTRRTEPTSRGLAGGFLNTLTVCESVGIDLVPRGIVPVRFDGHWHLAWLSEETIQGVSDPRLTFNIQGVWMSRSRFHSLVEQAIANFERSNNGRQQVFRHGTHAEHWEAQPSQPVRAISSVELKDGLWDDIASDAAEHLTREAWCQQVGIPWRRGYLFSGLPGNGKTSIARALAGHLGLPLYVLNIKSMTSDEMLAKLISRVPSRAVLLAEDADCIVNGRHDIGTMSSVSFAGLLNAIDGVAATEGRILVLTTNHPEQLDAALIRPGRIDRQWHIDNPTREQAYRIALRICANETVAARLADQAIGDGCSAAWVQGEAMKWINMPKIEVTEAGSGNSPTVWRLVSKDSEKQVAEVSAEAVVG